MNYVAFILAIMVCSSAAAQVTQAESPLQNQAQEQRAHALFRELRCEVCDGQTIADSNAPLAQDMRGLVRKQVADGQSDEVILRFFAQRYGDDILMRPPLNSSTAPLWLGPAFIILMGIWFIIRFFARKKQSHF